jgi:AcrR family transcriptional regulator
MPNSARRRSSPARPSADEIISDVTGLHSGGVTTGSRLERRKAQTRRKLIDAARVMLADATAQRASIQQITEAADVGFGSFYNHFTSKDDLFDTAALDVLDETGQVLDQLSDSAADPAAAFANSVRLVARFAASRPEIARILVGNGMSFLDSDRGLAPRVLRDIEAAIAAGRFTIDNPPLALAMTAGSLLAALHLSLTRPGFADESTWDQLTEQLLRMLGMTPAQARKLASSPLPGLSLQR